MSIKKTIFIKLALWFLATNLCLSKSTQAQPYIIDIQKISVEDGLSSRFVNVIYEDSRGFMWIGTQYGLNRYDGYEFRIYTTENSSLASNNIEEIYEDKNQRLWIIHDNTHVTSQSENITILNLHTGRIQTFEETFKNQFPFSIHDIEHIYSNTEKELWISTEKNTIYRYDTNHFELIFSMPAKQEKRIEILYADDQYVWLYYAKKLLKVSTAGKIRKQFSFHDQIRKIGIDQNNMLWLFQSHEKDFLYAIDKEEELQIIDLKKLKLPEYHYESSTFKRYFLNPVDQLIWYGDGAGHLFVFHPEKGIVYNLRNEIAPLLTHEPFRARNMYFDSGKRSWLATHEGIFIITLKKNKFTKLISDRFTKYSTRGITEDQKGVVYINTYKGRILIDRKTKEIKKHTKGPHSVWMGASRDRQNNLWFSRLDTIIEKYNPVNRQSHYYYYSGDTVSAHKPRAQWTIIRDKTGRVWTGSNNGLHYLDPESGHYQTFIKYNSWPLFGKSTIYHLHEDEKGLWLASSSGLYHLDTTKGITARYAKEEQAPYHIPHSHILHFHRDQAGIFWLATRGED